MNKPLLLLFPLLIVSCALPPLSKDELSKMSNYQLCERTYYSAGSSLHKKRWESFVDELNLRKFSCDDIHQSIALKQTNNDAAAAALILGVIGSSSNYSPQISQPKEPAQCRVIKGAYGDRVYCN